MSVADGFKSFEIHDGLLLEAAGGVRVSGVADRVLELPAGDTHFGMVVKGAIDLKLDDHRFQLGGDMFFVAPEQAVVAGRGAAAVIITVPGYLGLRQVGGPIEARGRLGYIDGCSDTLLVCPPRQGEPCLNHLHIPAGTDQTPHVHDSDRLGVVLRGRGICRSEAGQAELSPGIAWRIPAGCRHSFATSSEALDVLAWHPDSDFGPTDEDHPMINRTIIDD